MYMTHWREGTTELGSQPGDRPFGRCLCSQTLVGGHWQLSTGPTQFLLVKTMEFGLFAWQNISLIMLSGRPS